MLKISSLQRYSGFMLSLFLWASATQSVNAAAAPQVALKTSAGTVVVELDSAKAPATVANFLKYVKKGQYNGTIFHRVIEGFMIQGGGFTASLQEKSTDAPIKNEAKNGLKNTRYTIAMARTSDPHSASTQFFINTRDNAMLDYPGQDGIGIYTSRICVKTG